eukprot:Nk52_evm84s1073 gene=Nk52_evmTU84s1073
MAELPWSPRKRANGKDSPEQYARSSSVTAPAAPSTSTVCEIGSPGEYVIMIMYGEFKKLANIKIRDILEAPMGNEDRLKPLNKVLQQGVDPQFDRVLRALSTLAQPCLESLISGLLEWKSEKESEHIEFKSTRSVEAGYRASTKDIVITLKERRALAVGFIFCRVLIDSLSQGQSSEQINSTISKELENLAFLHLKEASNLYTSQSTLNRSLIISLYAELVGVLSQTKFSSVTGRFLVELQKQTNTQARTTLINGMKFVKLRMYPMSALDASSRFMQSCADYFAESKKLLEIRQAFADLFVELLMPCAAVVKAEVNVPAFRSFVEKLYKKAYEMSRKDKYQASTFPLVTALLCVSQKKFFLENWFSFLTTCLSHIKQRDETMQKLALQSVYRLVWVYIVRLKGESNTQTVNRLQSIVDVIFPKQSRTVVPREAPVGLFTDITLYMSFGSLDFVIENVVNELLNVGNTARGINPERMGIALRAFLIIVNNLEKKKGPPPFPVSTDSFQISYGSKAKGKDLCHNNLTIEMAEQLGISPNYYKGIMTAFGQILNALDVQVVRNSLLTTMSGRNKRLSTFLSPEKKPLIELLKDCFNAIPRLIPYRISSSEIIYLLGRCTIHMDSDLRTIAYAALKRLVLESHIEREVLVRSFVDFVYEIADSFPLIIEGAVLMLIHLLTQWKEAFALEHSSDDDSWYLPDTVVSRLEALSLTLLCSCRPGTRKVAVKLIRMLQPDSSPSENTFFDTVNESVLGKFQEVENSVRLFHVIEQFGHRIVESSVEKSFLQKLSIDGQQENPLTALAEHSSGHQNDAWSVCLGKLLRLLVVLCKDTIKRCIVRIRGRLSMVHNHIDGYFGLSDYINQTNSSRGTLSSSPASSLSLLKRERPTRIGERPPDDQIGLWRNYLLFVCCTGQQLETKGSNGSVTPGSGAFSFESAREIFNYALPLVKSEKDVVQQSAIMALGHANKYNFHLLVDLMQSEQELTSKKKRPGEQLRNRYIMIYEKNMEMFSFKEVYENAGVRSKVVSFIEESQLFFEMQLDIEAKEYKQYYVCFCNLVKGFVDNIPVDDICIDVFSPTLRFGLFALFARWCGCFKRSTFEGDGASSVEKGSNTNVSTLELRSIEAMVALCRAPIFDTKSTLQDSFIFKWVDSCFLWGDESVQERGVEGVINLLKYNSSNSAIISAVIDRCYSPDKEISKGFFWAFVEVHSDTIFKEEIVSVLTVCLYMSGIPDQNIRRKAMQMIKPLYEVSLANSTSTSSELLLTSLPQTLLEAQWGLSRKLSESRTDFLEEIISEMVRRLNGVHYIGRRSLNFCLVPWIEKLDFISPEKENFWKGVFIDFLYISARHSELNASSLEEIWRAFCLRPERMEKLIIYLIEILVSRKNINIIPHAKKIIQYFGRARPSDTISVLAMIATEINPVPNKYLLPTEGNESIFPKCNFVKQFDDFLPVMKKAPTLAGANIAIILLSELVLEISPDELEPYLARLIVVCFLGMDHVNTVVYEHCKLFLSNLIQAFVIQRYPSKANETSEARALASVLTSKDGQQLWPCEASSLQSFSLYSYQKLSDLLTAMIRMFKPLCGDTFVSTICQISFEWAITCNVKHKACRSLQMFRALKLPVGKDVLVDILLRLSDSVCAANADVQGYVLELLLTLEMIIDCSFPHNNMQQVNLSPALFWVAAGLLETNIEEEFSIAIKLLAKIDKVHRFTSDQNCRRSLSQLIPVLNLPPTWKGLQIAILKGLTSSLNVDASMELVSRFTLICNDPLVDSDRNGLPLNIISLVPKLISEYKKPSSLAFSIASNFADECASCRSQNLPKMFTLYANGTYTKDMDSWVDDFAKYYCEAFFPENDTIVLSFLVTVLEDGSEAYQEPILKILYGLLKHTEKNIKNLVAISEDFMSSVARLLRSEYWEAALKVLEATMGVCEIPEKVLSAMAAETHTEIPKRPERCWHANSESKTLARNRILSVVETFGIELNDRKLGNLMFAFDSGSNDSFSTEKLVQSHLENNLSSTDIDKAISDFDFIDEELYLMENAKRCHMGPFENLPRPTKLDLSGQQQRALNV